MNGGISEKIKKMKEKAKKISSQKREDSDNITVPDLQGRGVLIVEDDQIERERARKAIIEMGYLPFVVDNFARARRALEQSSFLFVLTDLHYPCCSGNNVSIPEQADPQPNGITLAIKVKMQGGKVAILTNQYHHGSVEWASNLCYSLGVPFLDSELNGELEKKKKWKKAVKMLKEGPVQKLGFI